MAVEIKQNWKVPVLDRNNHESWFRRMEMKLRAKECFYVIETSKYDFAWVHRADGIRTGNTGTPSTEASVDDIANSFERLGGSWNIEKAAKYKKDEATALFMIFEGLSETDESLYEEYNSACTLWRHLRDVKYGQTSTADVNKYTSKLQSYEFLQQQGVNAGWEKLKEWRRKLVSADPHWKPVYNDAYLFQVFTLRLLKVADYTVTIDALRYSPDTIEEKIKKIALIETDKGLLKSAEEAAHAAFQRRSRPNRFVETGSGNESDSKGPCYLCSKKH